MKTRLRPIENDDHVQVARGMIESYQRLVSEMEADLPAYIRAHTQGAPLPVAAMPTVERDLGILLRAIKSHIADLEAMILDYEKRRDGVH